MKRRGFVLNSVVLVLLIPLLLLVATYEDVSSSILQSQSERLQVEKTYRVVGYVTEDFENSLEISTRRALALLIDYVVNQRQFIDNASSAIESLILNGTYVGQETKLDAYSKTSEIMGGYTIRTWFDNLQKQLRKQGYVVVFPRNSSELASNINITVAPLDSFHIVVNASIPQIVIKDLSGKTIYNGSIDSVYAVISIENMEDPLIAYLTEGGFSQIIRACKYPYPSINRPIIALEGFGYPAESDKRSAPVATSLRDITGYEIYVGENYIPMDPQPLGYIVGSPGEPEPNTNPIVYSTVLNGTKISPTEVFDKGDIAAMIIEGVSAQTWCPVSAGIPYDYRMNFTVSDVGPNNLMLLKIPSSTLSEVYHEGTLADLRIYEKSTCYPVPFWIERWDDNGDVYIWIITGNTDEYSIYYSTSRTGYITRGNGDAVFEFFDDFNTTSLENLTKWQYTDPNNLQLENGALIIKNGNDLIALRSIEDINLYGDYAVRFRMRPKENNKDWDAGIGIKDSYPTILLFTDDTGKEGRNVGESQANYLAIHRAWRTKEGSETNKQFNYITDPRGDTNFHIYEVQVFPDNDLVYFYDFTNDRRNSDTRWLQPPLHYVYLVLDNEENNNWAYYDWIAVRKYLDETKLSYNINLVSGAPSLQYIDSDGQLKILENWVVENSSSSSDCTYGCIYEVNFTYTKTSFTDNSLGVVSSSINIPEDTPLKLQIITDNSQEEVYFDWIAVGKFPYYISIPNFYPEESKSGTVQGERNARAYNLQPFVDCLLDWRYFGVDGYPSFFERLEGNSNNRGYYVNLSIKMQKAIYGEYKYPIGLVSLVLPLNLPPNLGFLRGKTQTTVDYIYLNLDGEYLYTLPNTQLLEAYPVLGISTWVDERFYLDPFTATAIFGQQATCDLLEGYTCS